MLMSLCSGDRRLLRAGTTAALGRARSPRPDPKDLRARQMPPYSYTRPRRQRQWSLCDSERNRGSRRQRRHQRL